MPDVRHHIESYCLSVDDDPAAQSFDDYLLVCGAVLFASQTQLKSTNPFANAFPGDQYRLLAGLLHYIKPKCIVDIGTHYATGTRVMCDFAPNADIHTFDLAPWNTFETTYLTSADFVSNGGRVVQYLDDLSQVAAFEKHKKLMNEADFIMCDAPKDGVFEEKFYRLLAGLQLTKKPRWLFLDDIRFPSEMLSWRRVQSPKIDLTSFGHFSGTGLVDISEGLKFYD